MIKKYKILMIEDSRVFVGLPYPKEFQVTLVQKLKNFTELEKILKNQKFDAILLDIILNESYKTGLQMIKDILTLDKTSMIIMHTGRLALQTIKFSQEYGAKGFIAKDLNTIPETFILVKTIIEKLKTQDNVNFYLDPIISARISLDTFHSAEKLTDEEIMVLECLAKDKTPKEIEAETSIKSVRVDTLKKSIIKKTGETTNLKIVLWGIKNGYITPY